MNRTLRKLSQALGAIGKDFVVDTVQGGFPVCQVMMNIKEAKVDSVLASTALLTDSEDYDPDEDELDTYRCVSVTGNQASVYGTVIVRGYDWSHQVVEDHIVCSGTVTASGVQPMIGIVDIELPALVAPGDSISVGRCDKLGVYRPVKDFDDDSWVAEDYRATGDTYWTQLGGSPVLDSDYGTIYPGAAIVDNDSFKLHYLTELF